MTSQKSAAPAVADARQWSRAEKEQMNRFLDELAAEAKATPKPSLAQRSLAQARDIGRQQARQEEEGTAMLDRRPNSPPPEPFSLDLYVDGVVKRLNRSAAFVRNDPRSRGMHTAAVQFRINPNGSLKSFTVLNAGDQQEEIAFIKSVVERSPSPSPRSRPTSTAPPVRWASPSASSPAAAVVSDSLAWPMADPC
jgi:hypothetical protein